MEIQILRETELVQNLIKNLRNCISYCNFLNDLFMFKTDLSSQIIFTAKFIFYDSWNLLFSQLFIIHSRWFMDIYWERLWLDGHKCDRISKRLPVKIKVFGLSIASYFLVITARILYSFILIYARTQGKIIQNSWLKYSQLFYGKICMYNYSIIPQ